MEGFNEPGSNKSWMDEGFKKYITQLLNATILWVQLTIFSAAIPYLTISDISDYV